MTQTDWSLLRGLNLEEGDQLEEAVTVEGDELVSAQQDEVSKAELKSKRLRHLGNPIAWLDLEMTGLDVERNTILQAAIIVTDGLLRHQVQGPDIAIHHSAAVLDGMNDWCTTHHTASGLVQRCQESTISMAEAEDQLLTFIQPYTKPGRCPLAGNSVHVDVAFLRRHMPTFLAHFNHRIVDVSSISELARRWYPEEHAKAPRKSQSHLAMVDIQESIDELKYFRSTIFRKR